LNGEQEFPIEVRGVSFSYGDSVVFNNVSFAIPEGDIWAILGRSGIGKSTLLHVISGLYLAREGEVIVRADRADGPGRIRGVIFQEPALLGWLTVAENVLFPEVPTADMVSEENGMDILIEIGMGEHISKLPRELSFGMKRRAEFARALVSDGEFLLADEPFTGIDVITKRELYDLWRRMRDKHRRTGMIATHDPNEALELADKILVMHPCSPGQGSETSGISFLDIPDGARNEEGARSELIDEITSRLSSP